MIRYFRIFGLLVLVAVLLAACGSTKTVTKTRVVAQPTPVHIAGLPPTACSLSSTNKFYAMQCAGYATGQTPQALSIAPVDGLCNFGTDTYGGDASLAGSCSRFNLSYLSGYPGGKDWTSGGLAAWHDHGKATGVVFEQSANQAEYGCGQGLRDAHTELNEANEEGIPSYAALRFAVDTETSAGSVAPYFRCAKEVVGNRIGAYGSYTVVNGLENDGITSPKNDWQTVAWSYGARSRACVYQASINDWISGQSTDIDYTSCANWGQFPYKQAPTLPKCFGKGAVGNATCRKVHAEYAADEKAVTESSGAYDARGCVKLVANRNMLQQRWEYFHARQHTKYRHKYRVGALKETSIALNRTRGHISEASCLVFSGRVSAYSAAATKLKKAYS